MDANLGVNMTVNVNTFDKLKEALEVAKEMGENNPYITLNVNVNLREMAKSEKNPE